MVKIKEVGWRVLSHNMRMALQKLTEFKALEEDGYFSPLQLPRLKEYHST